MNELISRQAAIDSIMEEPSEVRYPVYYAEKIRQLPSAQRKGKWLATQEWGGRNYFCSCCKFSFIVDTCMLEPMWNFCPNCGAEMKGESGEESL